VRILLDECIDESLRHSFGGHECHTCRYAGLKGLTNGDLLDKNLPRQQNLANRVISAIVLNGNSTNIDDLVSLMPDVLTAMDTLGPGQFLRIDAR